MTSPRRVASIALTALVGISCSSGPQPSAAEQQIRDARTRFNEAIIDRDVSAIETVIAPNYHLLSSMNNHTHGRDASRDMWSALFSRDTSEFYVRTTRDVRVNEEWGHAEELGNWDGRRKQAGERVRVFGTYAAKWIRTNSTWTLQSEVFTLLGCEGASTACAPPSEPILDPTATALTSGTTALLQAVSVVNADTVWVSGHDGTYARTTDGGATWMVGTVPEADTLEFRDVHAVNGSIAYLLAAGPGNMSRIYKTADAGSTWDLQFLNAMPTAFFDCMDFWDATHGVAFSDAVDGSFVIIRTSDGETWDYVPVATVPAAQDGEGSFAASGTCLSRAGDSHAWIGTGAAEIARVLYTTDRGRTWSVTNTGFVGGSAAGIAALAFADTNVGWAFGGNLGDRDAYTDNVAQTTDGGATWTMLGHPTFTGPIYGASIVPGTPTPSLVVVGPEGMDYSIDGGQSWLSLDTLTYWAVDFASPEAGWAVGPEGRIAKVALYR